MAGEVPCPYSTTDELQPTITVVTEAKMHAGVKQSPLFCADSELGYQRSRTKFEAGRGLMLDDSYRLAHLPLVAPDHPRVIASREGKPYVMGRHPTVLSLGLPIDAEQLEASPAFRELDEEIRTL